MASATVIDPRTPVPLDLRQYPLIPRAQRVGSTYVAFQSLAVPALNRLPDISPAGRLRIAADQIRHFMQPRGRQSVRVATATLHCYDGDAVVLGPPMFGLLEPDRDVVGDAPFCLLVLTPRGELIELTQADVPLFDAALQDRLERLLAAASAVMTLTISN